MLQLALLCSLSLAQEVPRTPAEAPTTDELISERDAALAALAEAREALIVAELSAREAVAAAQVERVRAGADVAFYEAVVALFSADELDAIEALAATRDPRALRPLVATVERRSVEVAVAAARSLSRVPGSEAALTSLLERPSLATPVKLAVAASLGSLGTEGAADALLAGARREAEAREVQAFCEDVVRHSYPHRIGELPERSGLGAAAWLGGGGAYFLGHDLGMLGALGQSDLEALGAVAGGAGGAAGGWALSRARPISTSDAAFLTTAGTVGTISGTVVGASMDGEDAPWVGGFLGQVGALGVAAATRDRHDGTPLDSVEATGLGFLAMSMAGWSTQWIDGNVTDVRRSSQQRLMAASLLAGAAVGHVAAPKVDLHPSTARLAGLSVTYGALAGGLLPVRGVSRGELAALGGSVGGIGAYVGGHFVEVSHASTASMAFGMSHGGLLGASVGVLAEANPEVSRALVLGGITAGLAGGAALGETGAGEIKQEDVLFVGLVTGWSTYQAAGWYSHATRGQISQQQEGFFLLVPAAASLAGGLATRAIDVPPIYVVTSASMGVWGGYLGATVAVFTDKDVLVPALIGSNVGLAGGLALGHPRLGASPVAVGLADAGGVLGGSVAALLVSFATPEPKAILAGSLFGAAGGFAAGAVVGGNLEENPGERRIGRLHLPRLPGTGSVQPAVTPGEHGLVYGLRVQRFGF